MLVLAFVFLTRLLPLLITLHRPSSSRCPPLFRYSSLPLHSHPCVAMLCTHGACRPLDAVLALRDDAPFFPLPYYLKFTPSRRWATLLLLLRRRLLVLLARQSTIVYVPVLGLFLLDVVLDGLREAPCPYSMRSRTRCRSREGGSC